MYSCREKFTLFGEEERVCLDSGIWAGSQPVCEFNLALEGSSLVSSTLWNYRPGLAVDGDIDTCMFTLRTPEQRYWQVDLGRDYVVGSVAIVINKGVIQVSPTLIKQQSLQDTYQEFTIFVVQLLSRSEALYKPCNTFKGRFQTNRILFPCNNGDGHNGRYIYVRDDRRDQEFFGLCEVEVFAYRGALCGDPEEPVGGHATITKDGTAMYTCDTGHKLLSEPNRTCEKNGRWAGHSPQCEVIKCGYPPLFPNSEVKLLNRTTVWNALAAYSCKSGYNLSAGTKQTVITCMNTGEWEKISLTCTSDGNHNLPIVLTGKDWEKQDEHGKKKSIENNDVNTPGLISIGIISGLIIIILIAIIVIVIKRYRSQKSEPQATDDFLMTSTKDNASVNTYVDRYSDDSTSKHLDIKESTNHIVHEGQTAYNNTSKLLPQMISCNTALAAPDAVPDHGYVWVHGTDFSCEQTYPLHSFTDYPFLRPGVSGTENLDSCNNLQQLALESVYDTVKGVEFQIGIGSMKENSRCSAPSEMKTFLQPVSNSMKPETKSSTPTEVLALYAQVDKSKKKKTQPEENNISVQTCGEYRKRVSFSTESSTPTQWNDQLQACSDNNQRHHGIFSPNSGQMQNVPNMSFYPSCMCEVTNQIQSADSQQL